MRTIGELRTASARVEAENEDFAHFCQTIDGDELDARVHSLHQALFAAMDCRRCQNCCTITGPELTEADIRRLARHLKIAGFAFKQQYLEHYWERWFMADHPCPFLTAAGCRVYADRPELCRAYPFTDQPGIGHRLDSLAASSGICPVVDEIFTRLKAAYRAEYAAFLAGAERSSTPALR